MMSSLSPGTFPIVVNEVISLNERSIDLNSEKQLRSPLTTGMLLEERSMFKTHFEA